MDFPAWRPYYEALLDDFGFDRSADNRTARHLNSLLAGHRLLDVHRLRRLIAGRDVTVCGNSPGLVRERIPGGRSRLIIAADGATTTLLRKGIRPDVIVTDLDGEVGDQVAANRAGTPVVIQAHGDNRPAVDAWLPRFSGPLVGTTQGRPFGRLHNFGGFTDGDRAVFLAEHCGARRIDLRGFDFLIQRKFTGHAASRRKIRKLTWAALLIALEAGPRPVVLDYLRRGR